MVMHNNYPYPAPRMPATPMEHLSGPTYMDFPVSDDADLFRHYWGVIRRHIWMILAFLAAAEIATLIFLAHSPRLYTASSTISIEPQTPDVMSRDNNRNVDNTGDPSFYATEWEVLRSRAIAARISPKTAAPSPRHSADDYIMGVDSGLIDAYLSGLTIRPQYETRMVVVSYTSRDPVLAARLANAHVQAYIQQGYDLRTRSSQTAEKFLEGQLGELEQRLEKSEAELNEYRQNRGIMAFALDDKDRLVSERIADINKDLVDAQERRIALQAEVETIRSNDYDALPEVVGNNLVQ